MTATTDKRRSKDKADDYDPARLAKSVKALEDIGLLPRDDLGLLDLSPAIVDALRGRGFTTIEAVSKLSAEALGGLLVPWHAMEVRTAIAAHLKGKHEAAHTGSSSLSRNKKEAANAAPRPTPPDPAAAGAAESRVPGSGNREEEPVKKEETLRLPLDRLKPSATNPRKHFDEDELAGVDKLILKSVPVWLLGVQREANEVKRTLSQIPANVKRPTSAQVATLGLGQFYACWHDKTVKVYVQPAWLDDDKARQVALGELAIEKVQQRPVVRRQSSGAEDGSHHAPRDEGPKKEDVVNQAEADRLEQENRELRAKVAELESAAAGRPAEGAPTGRLSYSHLPPAHETPNRKIPKGGSSTAPATGSSSLSSAEERRGTREDDLAVAEELVYQKMKARLMKEAPALLRLLAEKPEKRLLVPIEAAFCTLASKEGSMTFAEKLRELRTKAGISEAKLAKLAGVPFGTLHNYGQGIRRPTFAAVVKIADALGVSCEAFAGCDDVGRASQGPAKPRKKK